MKNIFLFALVLLHAELSFGQIKIIKATNQKTFAGMGGVFVSYLIEFKSKTSVILEVDSVKSIADKSTLEFDLLKNNQGIYEIHFNQGLKKPEKCRTCPDMAEQQINLTKGVIIYYKRGGKKNSFKLKKFEELPDIMAP